MSEEISKRLEECILFLLWSLHHLSINFSRSLLALRGFFKILHPMCTHDFMFVFLLLAKASTLPTPRLESPTFHSLLLG